MSDIISNPAHYTEGRAYEPKDVIAEYDLNFYMGCVVKYISRAGRKEGSSRLEDLEKARQYAVFEQNRLKEIDRELFAGYDSVEEEAAKICEDWELSEFLEEAFKPILEDYAHSCKVSENIRKRSAVEKVIKWIGREIEKEENSNVRN